MMSQQAQQLQQQQAQQQQQQQAQQGQQGQGQLPGQAPQPKSDQINFLKHPIVYVNSHCAILKLLSSFSGSDYYELLNSIYTPNKHALKYFINSDSDEINKAIVIVIARAVNLTCIYLFFRIIYYKLRALVIAAFLLHFFFKNNLRFNDLVNLVIRNLKS